MADEADIAYQAEQRFLENARAQRKTSRLAPMGACHYCGEPFSTDDPLCSQKLFCDVYCAQDHEKETRLRSMSSAIA